MNKQFLNALTLSLMTIAGIELSRPPNALTSGQTERVNSSTNKTGSFQNLQQFQFGALIRSIGDVSVDGNAAPTGATIQEGQTLSTGNGEATVELGKNGLFVLGPYSKVFFTNTDQGARITCLSQTCRVRVQSGSVQVEGINKRLLKTGDEETLHTGEEAVFIGRAYLTINLTVRATQGRRFGRRVLGLLALIGVGAGVATGVAVGNGDSPTPASPIR